MTVLQVVKQACTSPLVTEDGDATPIRLRPPLSAKEIAEFESDLPCPLPNDIRELLAFCQGFEGGAADHVDFTGGFPFGLESVFPYGLPIAADGYGNFWVVDLLPTSTIWAPIYFACHDAPVILYQSPSLEHFLTELFRCSVPPHESLVHDVHDDRLFDVWRKNPGVISRDDGTRSSDADLRSFALELDASFQIIDLRDAPVGFGFSWGRYGPNTVVRRFGTLPIFAYQKPKGFIRTLFGT